MKKISLFCFALLLSLSGCSSSSSLPANNSLQTAKSTDQAVNTQFIMGGKVAANEQANITTKITGKVAEILVDLGSKVKQGDVLIKLDTKDLQAQVDQAQASLNISKANLNNALSGSRPEQIASTQATVDSAAKAYEIAKKNYARIKSLVDSGVSAQKDLDSAEQQVASAEGQLKSNQQQLNQLLNGSTKTNIDIFQAQVDQAAAVLNTAQVSLSNATITAPIDGVISAKNINVGELASAGTTLVSLVNSSAMYVNAYAPSEIVSTVKEGQEVAIKISELPDKMFKGKIAVINSKLNDQSRNILVKVNIEDPDSLVKPGMFAEIGLIK